jgi:aspartate aminotransferase
MACLDPGDEVIIPEPFYANYNGFAVAAGVVVKPISSSIETGFALPLLKILKRPSLPKQKPS